MPAIKLKTGRKIIFRQLRPTDFNEVYQWVKAIEKEDTFVMMNAKEPLTQKEVKDFINEQIKKAKQKKVVKIGVFNGKKYLGGCDITQLAKEKLKLKQVILGCFANNKIGINLYKKLGFKEYGLHPKAVIYKGQYIDEIMFYKNLE